MEQPCDAKSSSFWNTHKEAERVGYCSLIIGPMFSGKTTRLLSELARSVDTGFSAVYITHSSDNRKTLSHNCQFFGISSRVDIKQASKLEDLDEEIEGYDVVGIDEAQFFDSLDVIREWVSRGKRVFVSSLNGDYRAKPFGRVGDLICIADEISDLKALCSMCLRSGRMVDAQFSHRLSSGNEQTEVGGSDKYEARCRRCHPSSKAQT